VCCSQDVIVASESDNEIVVYLKENDFIVHELCCDSESDHNFYSDSNIVPATYVVLLGEAAVMITGSYCCYFYCMECCAVPYNCIFFAYNSPSLMVVTSKMLYIWFLKIILASRLQERETCNEEVYKCIQ